MRVGGIITDDCLLSYAAEIYLIQRRTSRMPCRSRALILSEALCRKVFGRLRQPRAADGEPASNVTSVIELYWALLEISSRETLMAEWKPDDALIQRDPGMSLL